MIVNRPLGASAGQACASFEGEFTDGAPAWLPSGTNAVSIEAWTMGHTNPPSLRIPVESAAVVIICE